LSTRCHTTRLGDLQREFVLRERQTAAQGYRTPYHYPLSSDTTQNQSRRQHRHCIHPRVIPPTPQTKDCRNLST
jgi:hypothetical protein